MPPIVAPPIACRDCGRQTPLWAPLCPTCQSIADDELPPHLGERYRDVLEERLREHPENC